MSRRESHERPQIFGKTLFVDLMMSTLIVVTALLMASNAVEKAKKVEEKKLESSIQTDGLYAIVVSWPPEVNDDVDLWVKDPSGNLIFYNRREAELMYLEYDDRGDIGDTAMTSSGKVQAGINRERAIIRAGMAGEYAVDVHMFTKRAAVPTAVKVSLFSLKGDDKEVHVKELLLNAQDRPTAFRFVLGPDGELISTNEVPANLVDGLGGQAAQQGGMSFPGGSFP